MSRLKSEQIIFLTEAEWRYMIRIADRKHCACSRLRTYASGMNMARESKDHIPDHQRYIMVLSEARNVNYLHCINC